MRAARSTLTPLGTLVAISVAVSVAVAALPAGAAAQNREMTPEERARIMAEYEARIDAELVSERPIEMFDSIWIEELTWMEVRDMMADGYDIAIVSTGGIEQNGPYVATGKHNYVLQGTCEAIARELGTALCAPIMKLVPEGNIDEPSGHMRYPGTISLRQETFEAVLDDVASSLRAHGFEHIVFIGDSGGNVQGMANVAARLNERWDDAHAHHIPEYYRYGGGDFLESELGIVETENDGIHDSFGITSLMMTVDPTVVRFDQRVKAGLAKINGVPIAPKEKTIEIGLKLQAYRTALTVGKIRESIANAGT
ncbi:creatininase family protein [Candidatus Palauibacter sp.]|uniref:creatininase family protein n=1 Tax=Candidatus Palauibacter sp. TaxID=3101350 RepID=UPI003D0E6061